MRTGLASKGDSGHGQLRTKLRADEPQKCFRPIQTLRDLGVSRKSDHEMAVYKVDVVLPSRAKTLDLPRLEMRELLLHHEPDEFLAQFAIAGRWFEQGAHSSNIRLWQMVGV